MKKAIYHAGNKVKYTGNKVEKYGGVFYELLILDGHKKGQKTWTAVAPKQ